MLHRLAEAKVDPERERRNELRKPDVSAIGLGDDRTCHTSSLKLSG
jgi:hypothetical protein